MKLKIKPINSKDYNLNMIIEYIIFDDCIDLCIDYIMVDYNQKLETFRKRCEPNMKHRLELSFTFYVYKEQTSCFNKVVPEGCYLDEDFKIQLKERALSEIERLRWVHKNIRPNWGTRPFLILASLAKLLSASFNTLDPRLMGYQGRRSNRQVIQPNWPLPVLDTGMYVVVDNMGDWTAVRELWMFTMANLIFLEYAYVKEIYEIEGKLVFAIDITKRGFTWMRRSMVDSGFSKENVPESFKGVFPDPLTLMSKIQELDGRFK